MHDAAPLMTSGTGQFKAVCHKCQYVGFEPNTTACRMCGFPLLLEPIVSKRLTVRDILDRSSIELTGEQSAPALPGVNRTQRQKREMLKRVQQRLCTATISAPTSIAHSQTARARCESAALQRQATDTPSYSQRDDTFIFRSRQRAETYQVDRSSQQLSQTVQGTTIDLYKRPRLGMVLALVSALIATLATAAASGGL